MIQRIQSVWLLLAAIFAFITFTLPFYVGTTAAAPTGATEVTATGMVLTELTAKYNIWLTILTVLSGATAFAAIFLFENRKLQLKVVLAGFIVTIGLLVVYFLQLAKFSSGSFALSSILHFAILGFYILAIRGIRKDEKLIKSLDRLR